MAYNPFNIFRRNQKAIFAVVTVIIMFVFVMSSGLGGGDFFEWFPRWLGKKSSKGGEAVCKLDGGTIYSDDLNTLRFQRVMASQFMIMAADQAIRSLTNEEKDRLNQVTDQHARDVLTASQSAFFMMQSPQFRNDPRLLDFVRQQVMRSNAASNALANSPTAKPVEREIVRIQQFRDQLSFQLQQIRDNEYFFNAPNGTTSDLVDFKIWEKKADQLGISFTTDDVVKMINHEFQDYFRKDAQTQVLRMLQETYTNRFTVESCLSAVGEEFRVRTAQSMLLGPAMIYNRSDKQYGGVPIFTPPFELFDFYREQMSPTEYLAVPVPVSGFINKVTGQPSEQELQKIYDDYRDVEPNPARETPGFKTPRQIKVDWVSATGAEPYYLKLAAESLNAGELQAKIGSMLTIPLPGMSPGWVAAATGPLEPKDLLLDVDSVRSDYTEKARDHSTTLEVDWPMPSYVTRLLDTSVIRPPTLAAALGGAIGGSMTTAGPLSGLGLFEGSVRAFELRDRIQVEASRFLGIVPGPAVLATVTGSQAAVKTLLPKPLTVETLKPELMKDLREQTARQLMLKDFANFQKEADKLSESVKDKALVRKYIDGFVALRGWKRGGSERLDSEWTMEDDPGLAPLKAALEKNHPGNTYIAFGQQFFWTEDRMRGMNKPATATYMPEYYPHAPSAMESPAAAPEPVYMVWRTEDIPSKRGPSFSTAEGKAMALAAWKHTQARELAKNAAESLANSMRSSAGDTSMTIEQNMRELANKLRDEISNPKAKDGVKVFDIPGVSPLTVQGGMRGEILPFGLGRTRDIPYPTDAMRDILLEERAKPPKTTFVLTDRPRDTYYVVTLLNRKPMTLEDFHLTVYTDLSNSGGMSPNAMMRLQVIQAFDTDAVKKTRQSVLEMLKQEFHFEATDEQKKKLEASEKRRGEDF